MGRVVGGVYVFFIVVFALYGTWWGAFAYKGFAYNLGRSLIWPVILFPGVGKAIGAILTVGFVVLLMLKRD